MKKKKGFTLIELVAVLVIMAVITLIATTLVLTLVNNSKASANKRSIDAYGKAVEIAIMRYLIDTGDYPSDLGSQKVEYTGSEVVCSIMTLNTDGSLYMSQCSVGGNEVKDKNTEDGWYHYGKQVEFNLNNRSYNVGDKIIYNGINYYVIAPSDETSDSVTLLKEEPLTVDEVNAYGVGHVNNYTDASVGTANDENGYGGMAYYSSATCRGNVFGWILDGCVVDYAGSKVKKVVDAWANANLKSSDLVEDATGYSVRLITFEELTVYLGYDASRTGGYIYPSTNGETPSWVYNENYWYWTMTPTTNSVNYVWAMSEDGYMFGNFGGIINYHGVVRPVINLYKSAL